MPHAVTYIHEQESNLDLRFNWKLKTNHPNVCRQLHYRRLQAYTYKAGGQINKITTMAGAKEREREEEGRKVFSHTGQQQGSTHCSR